MGRFSDLINAMFQRSLESAEFTSASPGHINNLIQVNAIESPDFEAEIKKIIEDTKKEIKSDKPDTEVVKKEREQESIAKKIKSFDKGNIGEVERFTAEQFGNVKSMASDPAQFIFRAFFKKFAKGAGIIALALLIFEAVKWVIAELLKPGRWLDRRFRRDIEHEILAFRSREEKQKLNQGLSSIIVTSIGGLRGGSGQTFNSYRSVAGGQSLFNKNFTNPVTIADGRSMSKNKGRQRFGQ